MATSFDPKTEYPDDTKSDHEGASTRAFSHLVEENGRSTRRVNDSFGSDTSPEQRMPATLSALNRKGLNRIGLDKAVRINETEAADAKLDKLFVAGERIGLDAISKPLSGSVKFDNWAGKPSLLSQAPDAAIKRFAADATAGESAEIPGSEADKLLQSGSLEVLTLDASAKTLAVADSEEGFTAAAVPGYVLIDNVFFDEARQGDPWRRADIGKITIKGDFPASDPARTIWKVYEHLGVTEIPYYSVAWENNEWRLKAINDRFDGYFDRENDVFWGGAGGYQRIVLRATYIGSDKTVDSGVELKIVDKNEPLLGLDHYGSLNENTTGPIRVGVLAPVDTDKYWTGSYDYTIVQGSAGFYIANGNELWYSGRSYNFETDMRPSVNIQVWDGSYSISKWVEIHINDVNDLPMLSATVMLNVTEGATSLNSNVTATDEDGDTVTFFTDDPRFVVEDGVIKVANGGTFDYETMNGVSFKVYAWDGRNEADKYKVFRVITPVIEDVNEAPTGLNLWGMRLREDAVGAVGGTDIGYFGAVDPDLPQSEAIKYSIVDPSGKFAVDLWTGRLYLKEGETLDYETASEYEIYAEVEDRGGLKWGTTYRIYIDDSNDAPTDIQVGRGITENQDPSGFFVPLYYVGGDTRGEDVFSIVNDPTGLFYMTPDRPNWLRLKPDAVVDYESLPLNPDDPTGPRYLKLTVSLAHTNAGTTTYLEKEVSIEVYNANDRPTQLTLNDAADSIDVQEQTPFVGILNAFDQDGDEIHFELTDGADPNGMFTIRGNRLVLLPGKRLDYESPQGNIPDGQKYYMVSVDAVDAQGARTTKVFKINILDGVDPTNQAPVIDVEEGRETTHATDNGPSVKPFLGVIVADADGDQLTMTISFDKTHGFLEGEDVVGNPGEDAGKWVYTFTGSPLDLNDILQRLMFNPNSSNATGTQITTNFTIVVSDGDQTLPPATNSDVSVITHVVSPDASPTIDVIDGRETTEATDNGPAVSPFTAVTIGDDSATAVLTLKISFAQHEGSLLGIDVTGDPDISEGKKVYTFHGTAAQLTEILHRLQFDAANSTATGTDVTTRFTIQVYDEAHELTPTVNEEIKVVTHVVSPDTAPSIEVTDGQETTYAQHNGVNVNPFDDVTITDSSASVTLRIIFDKAEGELAGVDVTPERRQDDGNGHWVYTFTGTAADLNQLLDRLQFDPTNHDPAPAGNITTNFTLVVFDEAHAVTPTVNQEVRVIATPDGQPPDDNEAPTNVRLSSAFIREHLSAGQTVGLLSADDTDPLSFTLEDDAGGAFELVGREIKVKDNTKIDFEQLANGRISFTVLVSDSVNPAVRHTVWLDVENLVREVVTGTAGPNVIRGGAGLDNLSGGLGNDTLSGGANRDVLKGDGGADAFLFDTQLNSSLTAPNVDVILDFKRSEQDKIHLDLSIFGAAGTAGTTLAAGAFALITDQPGADDRIIYDPSNGMVYYDPNGNGGAKILFAQLGLVNGVRPQLQHDDFFIVA
jgi:Ca2+-binding RTX toxin-like protein